MGYSSISELQSAASYLRRFGKQEVMRPMQARNCIYFHNTNLRSQTPPCFIIIGFKSAVIIADWNTHVCMKLVFCSLLESEWVKFHRSLEPRGSLMLYWVALIGLLWDVTSLGLRSHDMPKLQVKVWRLKLISPNHGQWEQPLGYSRPGVNSNMKIMRFPKGYHANHARCEILQSLLYVWTQFSTSL